MTNPTICAVCGRAFVEGEAVAGVWPMMSHVRLRDCTQGAIEDMRAYKRNWIAVRRRDPDARLHEIVRQAHYVRCWRCAGGCDDHR